MEKEEKEEKMETPSNTLQKPEYYFNNVKFVKERKIIEQEQRVNSVLTTIHKQLAKMDQFESWPLKLSFKAIELNTTDYNLLKSKAAESGWLLSNPQYNVFGLNLLGISISPLGEGR